MIKLCKTMNNLLGFPDPEDQQWLIHRCWSIPTHGGSGLRVLAGDIPRPAHVVESSAVGGKKPAAAEAELEVEEPIDPGAWRLLDPEDPLRMCTESLGSESSDAIVEENPPLPPPPQAEMEEAERSPSRWRGRRRRTEARFPPPLPWLTGRDGRRSCFMRGERRDGRLTIREVTIERPEVLRASRLDGRLRLELVRPDPTDMGLENDREEAEAKGGGGGEEVREVTEEDEEVVKEDMIGREEEEVKELRGEEEEVRWVAPQRVVVVKKKSEAAVRCQEAVKGAGIWWSNHCYATTA